MEDGNACDLAMVAGEFDADDVVPTPLDQCDATCACCLAGDMPRCEGGGRCAFELPGVKASVLVPEAYLATAGGGGRR